MVLAVLGSIFGVPPLIRYLKAPNISEDFGIEDAVVALRLEARDVSYLTLISETGETRSVRVDERGFEQARIAWSEHGLSTGSRDTEYLLRAHDLTALPLPASTANRTESRRVATDDGFVVWSSSPVEERIVSFIDAEHGTMENAEAVYGPPGLTVCAGAPVFVRDAEAPMSGVGTDADAPDDRPLITELTPATAGMPGLGVFDDVEALACDSGTVFGLGHVWGAPDSRQVLRAWSEGDDAPREIEIRYPQALTWTTPSTFWVSEGTAYWAIDSTLWSAPVAADSESVDATPVSDIRDSLGDGFWPVVGTDSGVLDHIGDRVYGVAVDEEFVQRRRGSSFDRLDGLAIFSADVAGDAPRIELTVSDFDIPRRDLRVSAIAVNPEWAAAR